VFTTRFLVGYVAGTSALFCAVAWLSRAKARRIAGALAAVAVFTAISAPIDNLGAATGLWIYPTCNDPPHPPLLAYVGQALEFVGCLALIGWRVQRSFGARGIVWLFAIALPLGACRDFSAAAIFPDVMRFGAQPAALFADVAAWAVVVIVALGVSRLVAGPARADALR
jgi:hypothetical protein